MSETVFLSGTSGARKIQTCCGFKGYISSWGTMGIFVGPYIILSSVSAGEGTFSLGFCLRSIYYVNERLLYKLVEEEEKFRWERESDKTQEYFLNLMEAIRESDTYEVVNISKHTYSFDRHPELKKELEFHGLRIH